MSTKRKCLECDYIMPEDSTRTYCNNCEPRYDVTSQGDYYDRMDSINKEVED